MIRALLSVSIISHSSSISISSNNISKGHLDLGAGRGLKRAAASNYPSQPSDRDAPPRPASAAAVAASTDPVVGLVLPAAGGGG